MLASAAAKLFTPNKRAKRTAAGDWITIGHNRRCLRTKMKWPVALAPLETYAFYLYETPIVFVSEFAGRELMAAFDYPMSTTKLSLAASCEYAYVPGDATFSGGRLHLGRYFEFVLAVLPLLRPRDFDDPRDVDLGQTTVVEFLAPHTGTPTSTVIYAPRGPSYRLEVLDKLVLHAVQSACREIADAAAPLKAVLPDALKNSRRSGPGVRYTIGPRLARFFEQLKKRDIDDMLGAVTSAFPIATVARNTGAPEHVVRLWATIRGLEDYAQKAVLGPGVAALIGATHLVDVGTGVRHPLRQVSRTFDAACWLSEAYREESVGPPVIIGA